MPRDFVYQPEDAEELLANFSRLHRVLKEPPRWKMQSWNARLVDISYTCCQERLTSYEPSLRVSRKYSFMNLCCC